MSVEPTDGALIITRFRGVFDCTRGERTVLSWSGLAAELTRHARRADKGGPGWAPVTFSDEPCSCGKENNGKLVCPVEHGHRIDQNVLEVYALALDVDKTAPDEHGKRHQLDQAGAQVALERLRRLGLRHIVHSSHSHAPPAKACYRVVVALSRSVASADFDQFWRAALTYLDIHHDPASKNTARFWYLPSCRPDAEPIAEVHEGNPLDVEMIMAIARTTAAARPRGAATRPRAAVRSYTPRDGAFDIDAFMAAHYPGVRSDDHGGGSRRWDIKCPWAAEHSMKGGDGDTTVFACANGKPGFKCLHGHCEGRRWRDFRRYHEPSYVPFEKRSSSSAHAARPDLDGGEHEVGEDDPDAEAMKPHKPQAKRDGVVGAAIDYISRFASHPNGPTLRRWRGDWYRWTSDRGHYAAVGDEWIDASLYRDFKLTRPQEVRDVRHALIAADGVLIDESQIGSWIGEAVVAHDPLDIAACPNGLLHLRSRSLTQATPRYFATTSLGVAYDPEAPPPVRWLAFLRQLWPQDDQSIAALQEWFGYLLTPDTRQQKIMLLVGPKRSGKGTIMRILKALLGDDSVAAPTLASLGTNFGLWPLIGKTAAIIGDARLGGRSDIAQIVERLLSVSGQDPQTIDRKHREPWTGYLSARMTIVSNELPRFTDASDALASRMLILELEESFYGREDTTLTDMLRGELSGILLWAIDGWDRLRLRGRFVQPTASAELVNDLADLASPVAAWVRERCERGQGYQVECKTAYEDYKTWCGHQGHEHRVTLTTFGRDLKAAAQVKRDRGQNVGTSVRGQNVGTSRPWVYKGIRILS